jgi:putative transposase
MPSSWTQSAFHLVFSTKRRAPFIGPELHERIYPFFGGIAQSLRAQLLAGNGMSDHVHLLVRCPADLALAVLAREVKARSSRWIHETFPDHHEFAWQRGYGGFTVSHSAIPGVEQYIRDQQRHHAARSFMEEFEEFLRKHEVEYDPRYVFE